MSPKSAGLAAKMGFTNIKVMLKGAPGWKKAGQMMVASNKFIAEGNAVIVDLRNANEVKGGHIARAVNIPLADLADAEEDFPSNKTAPIILYGNGDDAKKGVKIVKGWGFKTISLVPGGLEGWQSAGNQLVKGKAASEIAWVRIPEEGEVSIADFRKAAAGGSVDQVILDVRTSDEAAEGKFSGALHIPLDEVENRLAELPKDKTLLIHCTTGARAEMAYESLKKAEFKAKFLVAEVLCEDGECEIDD